MTDLQKQHVLTNFRLVGKFNESALELLQTDKSQINEEQERKNIERVKSQTQICIMHLQNALRGLNGKDEVTNG